MIKSLVRGMETSTEKELAAADENNLVRLVDVIGSKFVQRVGSANSQVYKQRHSLINLDSAKFIEDRNKTLENKQ